MTLEELEQLALKRNNPVPWDAFEALIRIARAAQAMDDVLDRMTINIHPQSSVLKDALAYFQETK